MWRHRSPPTPAKQRGVALITAVLIVAMASIAAMAMTHTLQLSIRRTGNILAMDQFYHYTLGSEAWARGLLIRDLQDNNQKGYDGLDEDWADKLGPMPVEGGTVVASTQDLQARFNLNNLYLANESSEQEKQRVARELAIFQRLLALLEIEESIAQATADWLDQDINPQFPNGAEDNTYLSNEQPYRTGNGLMGSVTELRLIQGMTPEDYEKLSPYLTVLPESTPINVNTADPLLLRAVINDLDEGAAEQLTSDREENPFKDKATFMEKLKGLLDQNKVKSEEIDPVISVSSRFYQLETQVQMEDVSQSLLSLLYKSDKGVVVVSRLFGSF